MSPHSSECMIHLLQWFPWIPVFLDISNSNIRQTFFFPLSVCVCVCTKKGYHAFVRFEF